MVIFSEDKYTGYVSEAFGEGSVMMIGGFWGTITCLQGLYFMDGG